MLRDHSAVVAERIPRSDTRASHCIRGSDSFQTLNSKRSARRDSHAETALQSGNAMPTLTCEQDCDSDRYNSRVETSLTQDANASRTRSMLLALSESHDTCRSATATPIALRSRRSQAYDFLHAESGAHGHVRMQITHWCLGRVPRSAVHDLPMWQSWTLMMRTLPMGAARAELQRSNVRGSPHPKSRMPRCPGAASQPTAPSVVGPPSLPALHATESSSPQLPGLRAASV